MASDIAKLLAWDGQKPVVQDLEMDEIYERLKKEMCQRPPSFNPMMLGKTIPDLGELIIAVDPGDHVNRPVITKALKRRTYKEGEPRFIVLDSYCGFKETKENNNAHRTR